MKPVILGIDPGDNAGAAVLDSMGTLVKSGQVGKREASVRAEYVQLALHTAISQGADLYVCHETWTAGGRRANPKMFMGLGANLGRWLEQVEIHLPFLPTSRRLRVAPQTWRAAHGVGGKDAEATSALTQAWAHARWPGRHFHAELWGADEVVAVGLAAYAHKQDLKTNTRWHSAARGLR